MSSFELILQKYSLFIIIFCLLLCIVSSCIIFSVIRVVIPHESYVVRDTNPAEMKRDLITEQINIIRALKTLIHIVTPDEDDIVIVVGPDAVQKLGTKISS